MTRAGPLLLAGIVAALCPLQARAEDGERVAQRVLALTNAFRKAEGRAPRETHPALARAAADFARYLTGSGKLDHEADGRTPMERARAHGYEPCLTLENIGWHEKSESPAPDPGTVARSLVDGWKKSPGHRRNLLDEAAIHTGVGIARDRRGRYYGVQLFGRPQSAAIRFTIENHAAADVRYALDEAQHALPPRALHRHTLCVPARLSVPLPGGSPFEGRTRDGAAYRIVRQSGQLAVVEAR